MTDWGYRRILAASKHLVGQQEQEMTAQLTPEILAARMPLVKELKVPIGWINALEEENLMLLEEAIRLAIATGTDWREDWIEQDLLPIFVIKEILPKLRRKSIGQNGRVQTQVVTGKPLPMAGEL